MYFVDGRLLFGFSFWALCFMISSYESLRLLSESSRSLQTRGWSMVSPWRAETPVMLLLLLLLWIYTRRTRRDLKHQENYGERVAPQHLRVSTAEKNSLHAAFSFRHQSQVGTTFFSTVLESWTEGSFHHTCIKVHSNETMINGGGIWLTETLFQDVKKSEKVQVKVFWTVLETSATSDSLCDDWRKKLYERACF